LRKISLQICSHSSKLDCGKSGTKPIDFCNSKKILLAKCGSLLQVVLMQLDMLIEELKICKMMKFLNTLITKIITSQILSDYVFTQNQKNLVKL
jgi:hypothetical protein